MTVTGQHVAKLLLDGQVGARVERLFDDALLAELERNSHSVWHLPNLHENRMRRLQHDRIFRLRKIVGTAEQVQARPRIVGVVHVV